MERGEAVRDHRVVMATDCVGVGVQESEGRRQLEPGPGFYQEDEVKKTRNKGRMALIVQAAWKITWL